MKNGVVKGVVSDPHDTNKRRQNFFGRFWYPPPPCRNFYPNLPNFYLLISYNIGISDPPSPPKIFRRLLWMAPKVKFKSTGRFRNIYVAFSEHMNFKRWCNNRPTHNDIGIDDIIIFKVDLCVLCIYNMDTYNCTCMIWTLSDPFTDKIF